MALGLEDIVGGSGSSSSSNSPISPSAHLPVVGAYRTLPARAQVSAEEQRSLRLLASKATLSACIRLGPAEQGNQTEGMVGNGAPMHRNLARLPWKIKSKC